MLLAKQIGLVLTIAEEPLPKVTQDVYLDKRIEYIHIHKADRPSGDIVSILGPLCDMIQGKITKGKVLRSIPLTVAAAICIVRSKHHNTNPNPDFRSQLEQRVKNGHGMTPSVEDTEPQYEKWSELLKTMEAMSNVSSIRKQEVLGDSQIQKAAEEKAQVQQVTGQGKLKEKKDKDVVKNASQAVRSSHRRQYIAE
ncbi:hypothetical protein P7C71_g6531, partial [Lecanoromycetidae sp. Uapishka_2]